MKAFLTGILLIMLSGCTRGPAADGSPAEVRKEGAALEDPMANRETRNAATSETGEYIPRDLDDALDELDRIMEAEGRDEVMKGTERDMARYHHGLGTWLRNNWELWRGSRLAQYFRGLGIQHPDDMSAIILDSYWRKLHTKPIDLEGQVRFYQDYWKKENAN